MAEIDIPSFVFWSILTIVIIGITGFTYRAYNKQSNKTNSI